MRLNPVTSVLLAANLLAIAPPCVAQRHDVTLVERWRTKGSPRVVEFASVDGVAETATGDIWITDGVNNVVLAVDAQGGHLRRIARTGDGPGEVRGPTLAARTPAGGVAIFDIVRQSVEIFGGDGRFIRRALLSSTLLNPKGLAVLQNGEILLSGGRHAGGGAVHRFGPDGRLLASWGAQAQGRNPRAIELLSGGSVAALPDGSVLYSQAAPHYIALYSATGALRRLLASDRIVVPPVGDEFIQERAGRHVYRWDFTRSAGVFRLADGNLLNVIWNQEANTSTWEVYRPSDGLIVRKRFARAYRPWALARNGDVLATVLDSDTGEVIVVRLALRVT